MKKLFLPLLSCWLLLLGPCVRAEDAPRAVSPPQASPSLTTLSADASAFTLDFPGTPVLDVLTYYGRLTGQQVVCDNSVQGSITLRTSQPVTREQAEAMIEEAVFLNGFSLVDNEDGTILKVVGLGKSPRSCGVPVFTAAADLPRHERVVSLIVDLRFAEAQRTAGLLGAYSPPNAVNAATPVGPHTLIITGPTSLVRRSLKVVEAMDRKEDATAAEKVPEPRQAATPHARPTLPPHPNDDDNDDD